MNQIRAGTLFGMVTSASSDLYAHWAIRSFFKYTKLGPKDRFVLIDNDNVWPTNPSALINLIQHSQPQNFSHNVNLLIDIANQNNLDLVFLSNDIILTQNWLDPLEEFDNAIVIPACNQTHQYIHNDLILEPNMDLESYRGKESLLSEIVEIHKSSIKNNSFETLLMPLYAFRIPKEVYRTIGYFDTEYLNGGEDIDYRIRALLSNVDYKYSAKSYILHFNGKSTWRGLEDVNKTLERNRLYRQHFTKKWGDDLCNLLMLGGDANGVLMKYNLMHFNDQVHSYNELIKIIYKLSNIKENL